MKIKPTNEQLWRQATTEHQSGRAQPPSKPRRPKSDEKRDEKKRNRQNRKRNR